MLHIIKLAVGIEDIEHLASVQKRRMADMRATEGKGAKLWHRTRHAPRRASELLDGGSMYWVIKGHIAARQRLIGFETDNDEEGRKVCFIMLDPEIVPTASRRHRSSECGRTGPAGRPVCRSSRRFRARSDQRRFASGERPAAGMACRY